MYTMATGQLYNSNISAHVQIIVAEHCPPHPMPSITGITMNYYYRQYWTEGLNWYMCRKVQLKHLFVYCGNR